MGFSYFAPQWRSFKWTRIRCLSERWALRVLLPTASKLKYLEVICKCISCTSDDIECDCLLNFLLFCKTIESGNVHWQNTTDYSTIFCSILCVLSYNAEYFVGSFLYIVLHKFKITTFPTSLKLSGQKRKECSQKSPKTWDQLIKLSQKVR